MAPWSAFWDRNFFAASIPSLQHVLANPFVRGGVSGIGGITVLAGLAELGGLFGRRTGRAGPSDPIKPLKPVDRPEHTQ